MSNKKNGTLYVGVTSDLEKRVREHKNGIYKGFTNTYSCKYLVRYEDFSTIEEAITYEKKIKGWVRKKKIDLIETENNHRNDLGAERF